MPGGFQPLNKLPHSKSGQNSNHAFVPRPFQLVSTLPSLVGGPKFIQSLHCSGGPFDSHAHYKQLKSPLWVPWWPSSERHGTNNSESVAAMAPSPRDLFLAGVGTLESSRAGRCWRPDGPPGDRNRKRQQHVKYTVLLPARTPGDINRWTCPLVTEIANNINI